MKIDPLKFENLRASIKLVDFLCSDGMGMQFRMKGVAREAVLRSIEMADSCLAIHEKEPDWNMHMKSVVRLYREALSLRKQATIVGSGPATKMRKSLALASDIMKSLEIENIILT